MENLKPSVMKRIVLTIVVSALFYGFMLFYGAAMPSVDAAVAVNQVKDSIATYAASQAFIHGNSGGFVAWGIFLLLLLAIWWGVLKYHFGPAKGDSNKNER
jgi:hypothetical protein